nr:retrovirus-related Pol polyprotein from transposon TNT 1-94 [Tanacetum cinerariifolium]
MATAGIEIPRKDKFVVTKPRLPPRRNINRRPSPKPSNFPLKVTAVKTPMVNAVKGVQGNWGNPQHALKDKGVIDSGYSRHMIRNMSYLSDFEELNGRYVAFGGNPKGGKISGKGKIRTRKLDFDDVYFVKELKFNLFSVSQMCNKKNIVLFTDTECIVLTHEFKLADENHVLLRVPRENNMYNVDLKNIIPSGDLTWIKREFSIPRTSQQNGIAERKNKTLIEAARTMLADSLLPIPFWAEVVNTACYVQNRALVTKPQNKTPYELVLGRTPSKGFMRPFGCPVTILNTLDPLGVQEQFDAEKAGEENVQQYMLFPLWSFGSKNSQNTDDDVVFRDKKSKFEGEKSESEVHVSPSSSAQTKKHDHKTKKEAKGKNPIESLTGYRNLSAEFEDFSDNNINEVNAVDTPVFVVGPIPTTRVHKDHHVTQIIDDLSSATQKRSMTRVVKDQGGLSQIFNEDFHTCMFACFLLQEEPKREEGIDYKEVFSPVARIEAIRLFLAYASFMGFMVYQMDVKSAFLYGTIKEERGKIDQTLFIKKQKGDILLVQVYVKDIIFGYTNKDLFKAFEKLMKNKFQMSSMGELTFFLGLQVKQKQDGIFISQDKYVAKILRKFGLTDEKSASTPIDTEKPLLKDPDVAYSDSDYAGASLDRKSTTGGCQFLGCRLISWQCKKQTVVATSSTKAEYVVAASCCAQVLWIQNQLLDYRLIVTAVVQSFCCLVNDVPRLQSLVDNKKVIITEATIQDALRLDDAESIDCLPSKEIFTELSRMGTLWNEFCSSMASAVICLSTGKGFSGVDTPLFEGMLVAQQVNDEGTASVAVDDVPAAADEPSIPSPTPTTQPQPPSQNYLPLHNKVEHLEQDKIAQTLEITKLKQRVKKLERRNKLKVSKLRRLMRVRIAQMVDTYEDTVMDDVEVEKTAKIKENADVQGRQVESQAQIYQIDLEHAGKVLSMQMMK